MLTTCTNLFGSFQCGECPTEYPGPVPAHHFALPYTGDGTIGCVDVDECNLSPPHRPNGGCDELTECINLEGSFTCSPCPDGYTGDGITGCVDLNECNLDDQFGSVLSFTGARSARSRMLHGASTLSPQTMLLLKRAAVLVKTLSLNRCQTRSTKVFATTCQCASIAQARSSVAVALTDMLGMVMSTPCTPAVLLLWAVDAQTLMSAQAAHVNGATCAESGITVVLAHVSREPVMTPSQPTGIVAPALLVTPTVCVTIPS